MVLALLHRFGKTRGTKEPFLERRDLPRIAGYSILFLFLGLLVVQVGFLFKGVGTPLSDYPLRSTFFENLRHRVGAVSHLPIPLPYPYLEGLDWVKYHEETGASHGPIYLLGERRKGQGFYSYFLIAVLFKVPIPTLVLFGAALILGLRPPRDSRRKRYRSRWLGRESFLLLPVFFFFVYLSFFFKAQIGLRFLLPAFPLIFIFCGSLVSQRFPLRLAEKITPVARLLYLAASSLSYHPHYLSYFNELVVDRTRAFRILVDSNLEWGQNGLFVRDYLRSHPQARLDLGPDPRISVVLREYLQSHPSARLDPRQPSSGLILVDANHLAGIGIQDDYSWLRDHFQPVDHIAYGWLVFDVKEEDLARLGLGKS